MDKEMILFIMDKNLISKVNSHFSYEMDIGESVSVSPDKVDIKSAEAVE